MVPVGPLEEAPVEQRDHATVVGGADQSSRGLDDAGHPRHDEGVLEAALEALVVVGLEQLLFQGHGRQAGSDDGDREQRVARVVDALGEHAARDREQQRVAGERTGQGVEDLLAACFAGRLLLDEHVAAAVGKPFLDLGEKPVAGEDRHRVPGHGAGELRQPFGDRAVVVLAGAVGRRDGRVDDDPAVPGGKGALHLECGGPRVVEAEQVAVELERLEGRGQADAGAAAVDRRAEEGARVLAQEAEAGFAGRAPEEEAEGLDVLRRGGELERVEKPEQLEIQLDEGVVRGERAGVAAELQVVHEAAVEGRTQAPEFLLRGRAFGDRIAVGAIELLVDPGADQVLEVGAELAQAPGRPALRAAADRAQPRGRVAAALRGQFRAVVAAAAVDQVVDLVDDQDRAREVRVALELRQLDEGVEGVVVVADDDLDLAPEFQADLERADPSALRGGVDRVRLQQTVLLEQSREELAALQLDVVVACVLAVVLVADDLVVGAHPRLGPQVEGAEGPFAIQQVDDPVRHRGLSVLRREDEHAQVAGQRLAQDRVQDGRGLAQTGRRLDQQVLALFDGESRPVRDLLLSGPRRVERELEPFGGELAPLAVRSGRLVVVDEGIERHPDAGFELFPVELDFETLDLGGADLDQHELGTDCGEAVALDVAVRRLVGNRAGAVRAGPAQDPGVDRRLPPVGRQQPGRGLGVRAHRLDLLDGEPAFPVAVDAVGAAGQGDLPAPVDELEREFDFPPIARLSLHRPLLVAAVDRLTDPEPLEAAAVGEAEVPGGAMVEQVRDG